MEGEKLEKEEKKEEKKSINVKYNDNEENSSEKGADEDDDEDDDDSLAYCAKKEFVKECCCASPYDFEKSMKEREMEEKSKIMEMIKTQDFINGYWEENKYTKIVKDIYQEEYDLLKGLKDKNIDDKTALTILIIYFINEKYPHFLNDFLMILKKS